MIWLSNRLETDIRYQRGNGDGNLRLMYFFKSQMCLLGTTARQTNELFFYHSSVNNLTQIVWGKNDFPLTLGPRPIPNHPFNSINLHYISL